MYSKENILLSRYKEDPSLWDKIYIHKIPYTSELYLGILDYLSQELGINKLKDLNQLFKFFKSEDFTPDEFSGVNFITKKLYELPNNLLIYYYQICNHILELKDDFLIQRTPTIRAHFQDKFCFEFYPFWHSDLILGHPPFEKNIWIPLTKPINKYKHGFALSSSEYSHKIFNQFCFEYPYETKHNPNVIKNEDFILNSTLVDCLPGEAIEFDSRIFHSALKFPSSIRLSLDIRIINQKYLEDPYPIYRGLGRMKMLFDENNYFISQKELKNLLLSF